ncbi:ferric iron uptake transcriptional regulator [Fangia hongkongensis]|uniref:ferric iron uptake transcriptional regulator n=1 Tax=Fangia hongkongensis TaxID=270495 RepID=UPI00037871A9|nr:ferric iron uptake transcriptional regulator [Fangia hongkongensis]MBK2124672.1 ferric iron uptake transcriptional regulator [Fangia hongkongensis]
MRLGKEDLKQAGLKITQQRLKILHIFENSDQRHLSADDVYRILQQNSEEVGIATVYRVLAQFESAGILQRLNLGRDQAVYELESDEHHDHMICISCHKVEEFVDPVIEARQIKAVEELGGELHEHSSVLYIKCHECIKKDKARKK